MRGVSTTGPLACFLIVATDRYRVSLRRWSNAPTNDCAALPGNHCSAKHPVAHETHAAHPACRDDVATYPHDDPRWPASCERCGAAFGPDDAWQVFYEQAYRRAEGAAGDLFLRALPPGAMYDATWLHGNASMCGPDGHSYILQLPDGREWAIDGPSSNGPGWSRTGEAPRLTARPSILTPGYHGWLNDGVLVPC